MFLPADSASFPFSHNGRGAVFLCSFSAAGRGLSALRRRVVGSVLIAGRVVQRPRRGFLFRGVLRFPVVPEEGSNHGGDSVAPNVRGIFFQNIHDRVVGFRHGFVVGVRAFLFVGDRYKDGGFQITKRARAPVAVVRVAPVHAPEE